MMYEVRYNYLKTLSLGFLYIYKGLTFPQARRVLEDRPARNMPPVKLRIIVVISNIKVSNTERKRYRNTFPSHSIYRMAAC